MINLTKMAAVVLVASLLACAKADDAPKPIALTVAGEQQIAYATHHVQGLAVTADSYWISSVDRAAKQGYVFRFQRATGKLAAKREIAFDAQFHPGGVDLAGGALWVPVAEYRPRSSTTIVKLDPTSLETRSSFAVDDHIGCIVAISSNELLAANWDARIFYRLDLNGKKLGQLANPRAAKYQDLKFFDGHVLAAGTELIAGKGVPVVDRLDPQTLALTSRWQPTGTLHSGGDNFCREGCAAFAGELFLMPEDGPATTVYRFALPRD